jgi:hypothetical protein
MATKRTGARGTRGAGQGQTKADFIRERAGLKPAEILADAHAAGIKLTIGQIYAQRNYDKRKGVSNARRTRRPRPAARDAAGAEQQLRLAIARVGLDRARRLRRSRGGVLGLNDAGSGRGAAAFSILRIRLVALRGKAAQTQGTRGEAARMPSKSGGKY